MKKMEQVKIYEALLGVTFLAVIFITGAIVAFRPTRSSSKARPQVKRVAHS
jgi:uncharacterized iron-regulated membrane protein